MPDLSYTAPPVISAFLACRAFVHLITGPFGSGKSTGCVMKMLIIAQQQEPGPESRPGANDGIRRSRIAVIRNTYRELMDTTKKTIDAWMPPDIAHWNEGAATFFVKFNDVECEIMLRALDTPEDVKKLLSLDLTCAWVNEAKQIPKAILDGLTGRVGRYPNSVSEGFCTWAGIFMDTNPPDSDHWIYLLFEEFEEIELEDRHNYVVFHQPSGLADNAENIANLAQGQRTVDGRPLYYARMMPGKTKAWIDVFIRGFYGFLSDGLSVYPEYNDDVHTAKTELAWRGGALSLGMDFGRTPALVVGQLITGFNQWQIIDEITSTNTGAANFAKMAVQYLKKTYRGATFRGYGDPAGEQKGQDAEDKTAFQYVQAHGLPIVPAPTNVWTRRREAVANTLQALCMNAQPALIISPKCKLTRRGMAGGYACARVQVSGEARYQDLPIKNKYSHPCEALQYLMVGEGMDNAGLDGSTTEDPKTRSAAPKVKKSIRRSPNARQ